MTEVNAFVSWRMRFHIGQRVWIGCKDARVEEIRDDGLVLRRTRRAGFARYFWNEREVASLIERGLLREYVKTPRKERA